MLHFDYLSFFFSWQICWKPSLPLHPPLPHLLLFFFKAINDTPNKQCNKTRSIRAKKKLILIEVYCTLETGRKSCCAGAVCHQSKEVCSLAAHLRKMCILLVTTTSKSCSTRGIYLAIFQEMIKWHLGHRR